MQYVTRVPMPVALRQLRHECAKGEFPSRAVNAAVASLGEGAPRQTRLAPPAHVLAGCKARDKRRARGGSMDDATRIDKLVRCHLIQRGMILLYLPGVQLVLTTPWALEQARLARMISTDAKVDTVTGVRSKWTSIRFKTRRGLSAPGCVWIAPDETAETIERGTNALACNLRCNEASCPHTALETYGADGRYERRLCCSRWWFPSVVIDKHIPSFHGLRAAQLSDIVLCTYHGVSCFDSRLAELGFTDKAADMANWGFRLLTRAGTDAQSFDLRDALACFLVRHAAMPDRLWTLAQAEELIEYVDKCWMYPDMIRLAWIDATRLALVEEQGKASFLNTTGISEGSHEKWTKMMMRDQVNRLISETVVKTLGITADGALAIGGGFFQDAETRWSDAEGRPLPLTTDRKVRHAKACLAFLTLGADCVYPYPLDAMTIDEFKVVALPDDGADEDSDSREWRRHRRQSGGRMSSSFHPPQLCAPEDAELAALVVGTCRATHDQQIADGVPGAERGMSFPQLVRQLQGELGDLSSRRTVMKRAMKDYRCSARRPTQLAAPWCRSSGMRASIAMPRRPQLVVRPQASRQSSLASCSPCARCLGTAGPCHLSRTATSLWTAPLGAASASTRPGLEC